MPQTPHIEQHFTDSETVMDLVIGMSDVLTVPFALMAGLSGAIATTRIIVTAELAEIAAGSIAMGLGGYLAARSDAEHYASERVREETEVVEKPDTEAREVTDVFESYGLTRAESKPIVTALRKRPKGWVDFMMRFELGLGRLNPRLALISAMTITGAYIAGGFIPLGPYLVLPKSSTSLPKSVINTLIALAIFGYVKGRFSGAPPIRSAIQTVLIGGLAAGVAFMIARAISWLLRSALGGITSGRSLKERKRNDEKPGRFVDRPSKGGDRDSHRQGGANKADHIPYGKTRTICQR